MIMMVSTMGVHMAVVGVVDIMHNSWVMAVVGSPIELSEVGVGIHITSPWNGSISEVKISFCIFNSFFL